MDAGQQAIADGFAVVASGRQNAERSTERQLGVALEAQAGDLQPDTDSVGNEGLA